MMQMLFNCGIVHAVIIIIIIIIEEFSPKLKAISQYIFLKVCSVY